MEFLRNALNWFGEFAGVAFVCPAALALVPGLVVIMHGIIGFVFRLVGEF